MKKATLRYDAFGKTVYENNAGNVKYRFSSKEWDENANFIITDSAGTTLFRYYLNL